MTCTQEQPYHRFVIGDRVTFLYRENKVTGEITDTYMVGNYPYEKPFYVIQSSEFNYYVADKDSTLNRV